LSHLRLPLTFERDVLSVLFHIGYNIMALFLFS